MLVSIKKLDFFDVLEKNFIQEIRGYFLKPKSNSLIIVKRIKK